MAGPSQRGWACPMSIRWLRLCSAYCANASASTGTRQLRPPYCHQRRGAEREIPRGEVAQVVVVAHAVGADLVEEEAGREPQQQPEHELNHREQREQARHRRAASAMPSPIGSTQASQRSLSSSSALSRRAARSDWSRHWVSASLRQRHLARHQHVVDDQHGPLGQLRLGQLDVALVLALGRVDEQQVDRPLDGLERLERVALDQLDAVGDAGAARGSRAPGRRARRRARA